MSSESKWQKRAAEAKARETQVDRINKYRNINNRNK
jgi:hypothetical protein